MSSNIWITTTSAQALEGSTATTAFTFTVWRDGDTSGPASVDWTVSGTGPSPANAADFINGVFPTGHVVIPAGQASATFTVLVVGDTGFESDEGFEVALSNPVGGLIGVPTAPGTATSFTEVVDNSAATALAMANTMLGTAAGLTIVSAQFTGEPAAASMYNAVNLGSAGGRSLALGAGILLTSGDGTPPASNTTDDYSVENFRLGDTALDAYAAMAFTGAGGTADATSLQVGFTVMPVGGTAPTHVSLDIMFGSEEFPEFSDTSFVDIAAIEIDGINYAYFNESNQQPLSVIDTNLLVGNFIDNQGNVLAIEYDGISAPLRVVGALNPLIAQHTIRIAIADTGDYSWDSGIFVSNLRAFTGSPTSGGGISVISQDSAEATILNDDAPGKVWISVGDAIRHEGHGGPTAFVFNVTRDGDTSAAASVAWAVSASGTHAANASDFFGGAFPSGTVSFAPGETAKTITVNVNGDTTFEPDETFTVTLSNAVGVDLGTGSVSTSLNDSASGGSEIKETYYTLAGGGGSFTLNYEMYSIPDQAEIFVNGALAATTGGLVSDTGTLTIAAADLHAGDLVLVRLTGNADSSTAWNYTIDYSGGVQSIGYLTNGTILNDDVLPVVDPGSPGNDSQTGTSSDDSLGGQDGDDEFVPGIGNDTVDGGPGIDKVRLPLFPNQFHFTATGTHQFSVGYMTFTTLITDVEYVEFGTQFRTRLPIVDMLSGKVQTDLAKLTDLYLAFFGRAPDVGGLEYWQEQLLEIGRDFSTIARDFSWSGEAQALFPSGSSNREFVRNVYLNCFGREPDTLGWDWWTAKLDALDPNDPNYLNHRGSFVGELLLGAYAPTSGADDRDLLTNRHEVAMYYANQLVLKPAEGFDDGINDLLKLVTGDGHTRLQAQHVIDHVFDDPVTLTGVVDNAALLASLWAEV